MKRFSCPSCRQLVYFRNTICLNCSTQLAYDPHTGTMNALGDQVACANRTVIDCNWLAGPEGGRCESCASTRMIPDLNVPGNLYRWRRLETEKRRLYYSLHAFGLPRVTASGMALRFYFLGDHLAPDGSVREWVLTGHQEGAITLNIAEADDDKREARRVAMGEPYRTLLGHLRHEVGHYYWEMLVRETGRQAECAVLFGDAAQDYAAALRRHYSEGAPPDWPQNHVSSYATAHPWEDWAETWAHMFHIVDGLDTAQHFEIDPCDGIAEDAYCVRDVDTLMRAWGPLAMAMNAMNRSMGHNDFYPFAIFPPVREKIGYMLRLIRDTQPSGG